MLEKMCFIIVHKKVKSPETVEFQGFSLGGDKRDRTADLLNAIAKSDIPNNVIAALIIFVFLL